MAKTRVLKLSDTPGSYSIDDDGGDPSFQFVKDRPCHREAAQNFALGRRGEVDPAKFKEAFWGILLTGWRGFVDEHGEPIPVEPPGYVVQAIRAEAKVSGASWDDAEIARRAGYRWRWTVVGWLEPSMKAELERRIVSDEAPSKAAMGNFAPSSVNG